MKKKKKDKFEFGIDFQQLILQLTVTDRVLGPKIIKYYEDSYFTLLTHAIIADLLKKYYKRKKRIPTQPILRENLRLYYKSNRLARELNSEDRASIDDIITEIYSSIPTDSDEILERCINFARYINFKNELENIDINKYDSYVAYADRLRQAQNIGIEAMEDLGTFLVLGMKDRAYNRDLMQSYPTPFWQFNRLLNSKGLERGNLIMIMTQQKRFKTGVLINIGLSYMRRRKKILYVDFENGQVAITTRMEQSIANAEQDKILSSMLDKKLMKIFRRYKRIGAEMVVKRMAAYKTTCEHIGKLIDDIKQKLGIVIEILICDYADLGGAISGTTDETKRISDFYVDMKNLAIEKNLECIWTASHIKREAEKRIETKFIPTDVAKCLDKISHVDIAIGLQESEEEKDAGVMRWEIIAQRNGELGRIFFWVNIAIQRLTEFTKAELERYYQQTDENEQPIVLDKSKRKGDL